MRILYDFVQTQGLLSGKRSVEVLRIELPANHGALERVYLYGVRDGLATEIGIRIARNAIMQGREYQ